MASGMLDEVATYLASAVASPTLTRGTNLFRSVLPDTPDTCVALLSQGGEAGEHTFGDATGVGYEHPRLQVLVRGARGDYDTPRATAHTIRQELAQVFPATLGSTVYEWIIPMQSPFVIERDQNERVVVGFNCRIRKEPS